MRKFKKIEIEAFRVYNEKQIFDFEQNGEIVNLAVIYGPNGFGKTSFNDAIEWGFTKQIGRISKNSIVMKTVEYEKGEILKNKYSNKKSGTVTFQADDNSKLIRTTAKLSGNTFKDYLDGQSEYEGESFKNIEESYGVKNILSHDQIDAFLKAVTPGERYLELIPFWDDDNTTEVYIKICDDYKEIDKRLNAKNDEIKKVKQELDLIKEKYNNTLKVDYLIDRFNNKFNKQLNIDINEYTNNDVIIFDREVEEVKQMIVAQSEKETTRQKKLIALKSGNVEYQQKVVDVINLNKKILDIDKVLSDIESAERISGELTKCEDISTRNKYLIGKYQFLIDYYDKYAIFKEKIKEIQSKIQNIRKELVDNIEVNKNMEIELAKNEMCFKEEVKRLDDIKQLINNFNSDIQKYVIVNKKKNTYEKNILKLERLISIREKRCEEINIYKASLNKYITNSIEVIVQIETSEEEITHFINKLKDKYSQIIIEKEKLKNKEQQYFNLGELNEKLNLIVKTGEIYIENSKQSLCPLCQSEFNDYKDLLKAVRTGLTNSEELEKLREEINLLKDTIQENTLELEKLHKLFIDFINDKISKQVELNDLELHKLEKGKNIIFKYTNKVHTIEKIVLNIIDIFSKHGLGELLKNKQFEQIMLEITYKRDCIAKSIKLYEENLAKLNENIKKTFDNNILIKSNEQKLEIESKSLEREDIYVTYIEVLKEIQLTDDIKEIFSLKESLSIKKKDLDEKINLLTQQLEELKNKGINEEIIKIKETYFDEFKKLKNLLKTNKDEIENYNHTYHKLTNLIQENILEREILQHILDTEKTIEKLDDEEKLINSLIGSQEIIHNNVLYRQKKRELDENEYGIKILEKALREIEVIYNNTTAYIQRKINEVFNSDIINYIYSRIEPHPQLTQIKFEPDFSGKKPQIHIYTTGENGEKAAPILFLSSAQLNILSLSIFYARALQNCKTGFKTVFMDDPVEHLDDINILSFIDLLRVITTELDIQVIMSTHDERFFNLLKCKLDPKYYKSKFIRLESYGQIKQ